MVVVIFCSLDGSVASFFQDMRDLFLFGRLYRFTFSGTVVIFYFLDGPVASFFQDMRDLFSLDDYIALPSPGQW